MIYIYLNIRGLGGRPKRSSLKRFIELNLKNVYFVQETMSKAQKICEFLLKNWKDWEACAIDSEGMS